MKALPFILPTVWPAPAQPPASARATCCAATALCITGQLTSCALQPASDQIAVLQNADGVELMQCQVEHDGRFLLHGVSPYRGVAVITVRATGNLPLRSVLVLGQRSHYLARVNPLTELLARKLGILARQSDSCRRLHSHSTARIERVSHALAHSFGLDCLHGDPLITPIAADGSAQHARANRYGQILASIAALGWMQQQSMAQILDQLDKALDSEMRLSADGRVALLLAAAESGAADISGIAAALGITELAQLIETDAPSRLRPLNQPAPSLTRLQALGRRTPLASVHQHPAHPRP